MDELFGKVLGALILCALMYWALAWFITHILPWLLLAAVVIWLIVVAATAGQGTAATRAELPTDTSVVRSVGVVSRPAEPYWRERGWVEWDGHLLGYYRAGGAKVEGKVDLREQKYFIRHPPQALRRHPRWHCFSHIGDGWFSLHFAVAPRDEGSGILYVERLLHESMRRGNAA
jgi:hypothetical protein